MNFSQAKRSPSGSGSGSSSSDGDGDREAGAADREAGVAAEGDREAGVADEGEGPKPKSKGKSKGKAKAKASAVKGMKQELAASKKLLSAAEAEVSAVKEKFRKWRNRHGDNGITQQFQTLGKQPKSSKRDQEVQELTKLWHKEFVGKETARKSMTKSTDNTKTTTQHELSYADVCNTYHLDIFDKGNTIKIETFIAAGYLKKQVLKKKEVAKITGEDGLLMLPDAACFKYFATGDCID